MERSDRPALPWSRLVTGIVIIAVGMILWLDQMDRMEARDYLRWWPVALIVIGFAHLLERQFASAAIMIGVGGIFLADRFWPTIDIADIFRIWPLTISIGGAALLAQALRPAAKDLARGGGSTFQAVSVMAGNVRSISARDFVGGDAVAVMGGCEIDLTRADVLSGEAILDVIAFWGGIEVYVPANWTVVPKVMPLLGSFDDHSMAPAEPGPRLIIRGAVIMASIDVRNARRAAEKTK